MRYTLTVPDDVNTEIEKMVAAAGTSKSGWIVNACTAYMKSITGGGEDLEAELARLRDESTRSTADRERLKEQAIEMDRLRADLAQRDQMLAEKADEIRWLRGEISQLHQKIAPAALTEQAGAGRRPWWRRIFG